jgi:predicted ATPase/DNA-binding SARP family transcriptional activator
MVQTKQDPTLRLHLLGEATLHSSSDPIPFAPDMRYQLLAYLAVAGEWVSRDKLADLFWSDTTEVVRKNLRQLLQRVQTLPWLDGLEVERSRLRWLVANDVADFRQAVQNGEVDRALELYKGALLKGLEDYDDTGFASWLELERESLHNTWRTLLLERADTLQERGKAKEATALLASLLERDDLDEEALALYLEASQRAGLKHQALRTYQAFRRRLRTELDLEPSAVTVQLADALEKEQIIPETLSPPTFFLPKPPTSLVGREVELAEVQHLLSQQECRLLTLTGPGGVGKTRLALETTQNLSTHYKDGVGFVPLASVTGCDGAITTLADILGLKLQGQEEPFKQVLKLIGDQNLLLVLDNFEHLLEGATLLSDMLHHCPNLKLLVTSRERLNLAEEWVLPIGGLALPDATTHVSEATDYDAVSLFAERAKRVQASFEITQEELPSVLKICRLVQGLPLGLELAAVWVRTMTCEEIASEIEASLDFLSSSARNVDERHSSLRATLDYSWKLLTEKEQEVLKKLSVFQNGASREAATVVAGANGAVLAALIDKSLLYMSTRSRYSFHPLVAQYAREKLAQQSEQEKQTKAKHAAFFLALAEAAEAQLRGAGQKEWLEKLETDHDNLRSALAWSLQIHETETGLRLGNALWRFWLLRGYYREGYRWLRDVVAQRSEETLARAKALVGAGHLAWRQGEHELATRHLEDGLRLARKLNDDAVIAIALNGLGIIVQEQQDHARARSLYGEALTRFRALGDKLGMAAVLCNLATIDMYQNNLALAQTRFEEALRLEQDISYHEGVAIIRDYLGRIALRKADLDTARDFFEEALALHRERGNKSGIAMSLNSLGLVAFEEKNYPLAASLHQESLKLCQEINDKWSMSYALEHLASVAAAGGQLEQAAQLWGAVGRLRETIAVPLPDSERPRYDDSVHAVQQQLGEITFKAAWSRGRTMGLEQAMMYALRLEV